MPGESIDIERIVREVLAAWQQPATVTTAVAELKKAEKQHPEHLTLADRVITLATLEGRLGTIKRLAASRGSVVTPAVRDELRRRGIELTFGESGKTTSETKSLPGFLLAADNETANQISQALGSAHQIEIITPNAEIGATLKTLADRLLTVKRPGVLLTNQPAAALCLANRNHSLRAIGGTNAEHVTKDANAIGANLLVASPTEISRWQLTQMIRAFVGGGWRSPPNEVAKLLAGT